MKYQREIFIMTIFSLVVIGMSYSLRSNEEPKIFESPEIKKSPPASNNDQAVDKTMGNDARTGKHIVASDILPNYRPMGKKTNSGLWDNYADLKYRYGPNYSGLEGHSWEPPMAAVSGGLLKIASPKPEVKKKLPPRIVAENLPEKTYSASSIDVPKRENILQIDVPTSRTKQTEFSIDPRTQIPPNIQGDVFHGIQPELPTTHGVFLEIKKDVGQGVGEKKATHNSKMKQLRKDTKRIEKTLGEDSHAEIKHAIDGSIKVEKQSNKLMASIEGTPSNKLIMKIATTNKQESPSLKLKYAK